jgi:hypothetical protein
MKENLKQLYNEGNDIFGYPQEYKTLKLKPIKLKDTKYHTLLYQVFGHPKMYIVNKDILKASYLKFIVYVVQMNIDENGSQMVTWISDLLEYITGLPCSIEYLQTGGEGFNSVKLQFRFGDDIIILEEEFDDLREIILQQNGISIDYIEDYRPDLEESLAFTQRDNEGITLSDEIFTFCSLMKMSIKEVEEYTLHQFKLQMEKLLVLKEYDLYQPLIVSGQVTLKKGNLKHYFYKSEKTGRYDSIMISKDEFLKGDIEKISA